MHKFHVKDVVERAGLEFEATTTEILMKLFLFVPVSSCFSVNFIVQSYNDTTGKKKKIPHLFIIPAMKKQTVIREDDTLYFLCLIIKLLKML